MIYGSIAFFPSRLRLDVLNSGNLFTWCFFQRPAFSGRMCGMYENCGNCRTYGRGCARSAKVAFAFSSGLRADLRVERRSNSTCCRRSELDLWRLRRKDARAEQSAYTASWAMVSWKMAPMMSGSCLTPRASATPSAGAFGRRKTARGAPQVGFSRDIRRIRSRSGRPRLRTLHFHRQYKRKPCRRQRATESGPTVTNAER